VGITVFVGNSLFISLIVMKALSEGVDDGSFPRIVPATYSVVH
jgi:hypothetical protein